MYDKNFKITIKIKTQNDWEKPGLICANNKKLET